MSSDSLGKFWSRTRRDRELEQRRNVEWRGAAAIADLRLVIKWGHCWSPTVLPATENKLSHPVGGQLSDCCATLVVFDRRRGWNGSKRCGYHGQVVGCCGFANTRSL